MLGAATPDATGVVDPVVALALAALELQTEGLAIVLGRLELCRTAVPASGDDTWRGPARTAYEAGLTHLRALLTGAAASVDEALLETRRAVTDLGDRIG